MISHPIIIEITSFYYNKTIIIISVDGDGDDDCDDENDDDDDDDDKDNVVLLGGHTGAVQSLGGGGDQTNGGGGSGGRIAIYHDTVITVMPYQGSYDTHGGPVGSTAEAGASGTVYIKHHSSGYCTVRVDNRNRQIKVFILLWLFLFLVFFVLVAVIIAVIIFAVVAVVVTVVLVILVNYSVQLLLLLLLLFSLLFSSLLLLLLLLFSTLPVASILCYHLVSSCHIFIRMSPHVVLFVFINVIINLNLPIYLLVYLTQNTHAQRHTTISMIVVKIWIFSFQMEGTDIKNDGQRLDLLPITSSKVNSFVTPHGHRVTTSSGVGTCASPNSLLQYLFDQSFDASGSHYFAASTSSATITITLNQTFFINNVRIFPNAKHPSTFKACN